MASYCSCFCPLLVCTIPGNSWRCVCFTLQNWDYWQCWEIIAWSSIRVHVDIVVYIRLSVYSFLCLLYYLLRVFVSLRTMRFMDYQVDSINYTSGGAGDDPPLTYFSLIEVSCLPRVQRQTRSLYIHTWKPNHATPGYGCHK